MPDLIVTPYNTTQLTVLVASIDDWAILKCSFPGDIDNHFPKDPLLQFCKEHPVIFPRVTRKVPIIGAVNIFTDGSKNGVGAFVIEGALPVTCQYAPGSPQIIELKIVEEVF